MYIEDIFWTVLILMLSFWGWVSFYYECQSYKNNKNNRKVIKII